MRNEGVLMFSSTAVTLVKEVENKSYCLQSRLLSQYSFFFLYLRSDKTDRIVAALIKTSLWIEASIIWSRWGQT